MLSIVHFGDLTESELPGPELSLRERVDFPNDSLERQIGSSRNSFFQTSYFHGAA